MEVVEKRDPLPRHILSQAKPTCNDKGNILNLPRAHFLLIIPLLISSLFYLAPAALPYAHATTGVGVVCIAKDGSTSCPPAPPLINSTNALPTHQLRVAVVVNASAGLGGF